MEVINDYSLKVDQLSSRGYTVNIEKYLKTGFSIFRERPELFLVYTALWIVVMPAGGFLFAGPLSGGFIIAAHRIHKRKYIELSHFFEGFRIFMPLFFLHLLVSLLVALGTLLFIIPGIYLMVAWCFAIFFVVLGQSDFREAMHLSKKLVTREWFSIFGLILILLLINVLGSMAFGIGLLFSIPVSFCTLYAAFDDILNKEFSF